MFEFTVYIVTSLWCLFVLLMFAMVGHVLFDYIIFVSLSCSFPVSHLYPAMFLLFIAICQPGIKSCSVGPN